MILTGSKERTPIDVYEVAAWANTVEIKAGAIRYQFTGRAKFSTLFPGRSLKHSVWSDVSHAGTGVLVLEDGDTFSTSGDYTQLANGGLEIAGGSYTAGGLFIFGGVGGTTVSSLDKSVSYLQSGGDVAFRQFNMGTRCTTNQLARQTGGTATACTYGLGCEGDFAGTAPVMEYRLEGGIMKDKTGAARDRGLVLCGYLAANNYRTPPGIFTQTGGKTEFDRVSWGTQGGIWTWDDWTTTENGRGYGLLDLRGGEFILPSGGFSFGRCWNTGSVSNSTYDIRLSGGKVVVRNDNDLGMAMSVLKGDGPSEWNTGSANTAFTAPLDGDGTLRKTGTGNLLLTDAVNFNGSVKVEAGAVEVLGRPAAPEGFVEGENLRVFTADSLVGKVAFGEEVTAWSDSTGRYTCRKPTSSEISQVDTYMLPTLTNSVANGHAGLFFNKGHVLALSAEDNPLAGETNFTFAVVVRPVEGGVAQGAASYAGRCIIGNDRNWSSTGVNCIELIHTDNNRLTLYMRNTSPDVGSIGRAYQVPTVYQGGWEGEANVSVAIVSVRGNRVVYDFNNSFTNRYYETLAGRGFNPRFQNSSGKKQPLYFGTSDVDEAGKQSVRCFSGFLMEARFYKGRALTEPEVRSLMLSLTEKYSGAKRLNDFRRGSNGSTLGSVGDARVAPAVKTAKTEWSPEYMYETLPVPAGCEKPELVKGALNGKDALRFDAARQTAFNMPNQTGTADPIANCTAFGIAFVFRTEANGTGLADATVGTGIYSSMLAGYGHTSGCGNSCISFREFGEIAGYRTPPHETVFIDSRKPCRLNDGRPHVVVFTGNAVQGSKFRLMVDGVMTEANAGWGNDGPDKWPGYDSSRPHVIGALRAGVGHFTGDIFGFSFWHELLTEEEMYALSQKAAVEYGFNLKERRAFALSEIASRGLGATNVTVAAGAAFRVPVSETSPFVVKRGVTLSGDGAFEGSYRFADGAVADFGGVAAKMQDVQVADGAVMKFGADAAHPVDGASVSSISGTVTVDITGSPAEQSKRSRYLLMAIDPSRIAEGTEFVLVGGESGMSVKYDEKVGGLAVVQQVGLLIIVR